MINGKQQHIDPVRLYTYKETANFLGISHALLSALVAQKKLRPRYIRSQSRPRIPGNQILQYVYGDDVHGEILCNDHTINKGRDYARIK